MRKSALKIDLIIQLILVVTSICSFVAGYCAIGSEEVLVVAWVGLVALGIFQVFSSVLFMVWMKDFRRLFYLLTFLIYIFFVFLVNPETIMGPADLVTLTMIILPFLIGIIYIGYSWWFLSILNRKE